MPNHIGAFLKASECFAALGINITRVSYDKAVDSHMLFLDVEGTADQIRKADAELEKIGYLQNKTSDSSIVLIEFTLRDIPGSVTDVLKLIDRFNFNISYINSQENGTDHQKFKMGLHVEDPGFLRSWSRRSGFARSGSLTTTVPEEPMTTASFTVLLCGAFPKCWN